MGIKNQRMYNHYGKLYPKQCNSCCNYQAPPGQVSYCLGYGREKEPWDGEAVACGLYGRPFNELRPKHRPLAELHGQKEQDQSEDTQQSLF